MYSRLFAVVFVLSSLLVFTGCSEGERGIFATIAIEEEIKKNNLVENASISGLVKGTFNGTERYVVVAGTKVFSRPVAGSDWDEIKAPGSRLAQFVAGRYTTADTAGLGGDEPAGPVDEVYVVYQSGSSTSNAVYRLNNNLGWDLVYTPSETYIDGMIGIDNVIFVSTRDNGLYAWATTSVASSAEHSIGGFDDGLRDGVRNGTNADNKDYYLIGKSTFIARVQDDFSALNAMNRSYGGLQPKGIGFSEFDGGILAVTDLDGAVYIAKSDTDPGDVADFVWNNAGSPGRPVSDIVWVSNINGGTGGFLVSTTSDAVRNERGRGYYEATISGTVGNYDLDLTNDMGNNYEASDLAISSISQFRHFGNGVVFALTGGLGLWSTVYPDSSNPTWRWE
jgi:hypothetical protein